ncbi:MAG TPA: hypothetical protein VF235_03545 [Actinomycetota bacterium]
MLVVCGVLEVHVLTRPSAPFGVRLVSRMRRRIRRTRHLVVPVSVIGPHRQFLPLLVEATLYPPRVYIKPR